MPISYYQKRNIAFNNHLKYTVITLKRIFENLKAMFDGSYMFQKSLVKMNVAVKREFFVRVLKFTDSRKK